jgi:hypothetical protein
MSANPGTDIASLVKIVPACGSQDATASGVPETVTAGGTNDNVKMTGTSIDLLGYLSVSFATCVRTQLTDTKTASITTEYQTSADNSTWATAVALRAVTVVATGTGSTTEFHVVQEDGLKTKDLPRYIRLNVTLTLSNTATDLGHFESVAVLGGADNMPAA